MRKISVLFLLCMLCVPLVARGQAKARKYAVNAKVEALSDNSITVIDTKNKKKITAEIKDYKRLRTQSKQNVPMAFLADGLYANVRGKVNDAKTEITSNYTLIFEPPPDFGKKNISVHGASGYFLVDGDQYSLETDGAILKIKWESKNPRLELINHSTTFSEVKKGDELRITFKEQGSDIWVDRVELRKPDMKEKDIANKRPGAINEEVKEEVTVKIANRKSSKIDINLRQLNPGHHIAD